MGTSDSTPAVATLVGDVISSREVVDQTALFGALEDSLDWVNRKVPPLQPLQLMTGDEFQGVYEDVRSALYSSLLLHLRLFGRFGLRIGIGWGGIRIDPDRLPSGQS